METRAVKIRLLTPCFCAGADQSSPEIRVASIRGHLRIWHRRIFGPNDVKSVWGGIGSGGGASKIQVRIETSQETPSHYPLLPHKGKQSGSRKALIDEFTVLIASRDTSAFIKAQKTLEIWSILGALGTRANRAAGSVWPSVDAPANINQLKTKLNELGFTCGDMFISKATGTRDDLRKRASDTLAIPELFGSASPREESPLKIKVVELADGLHLLVYAGAPKLAKTAIDTLKTSRKPLGLMDWIPV